MKGFKKLLTGILAATLAFTMNVTAFAASGTITVENTENGTTYNFYRIFDLTGSDSNGDTTLDVVSYTINSDWNDFFTNGDGASYLVDANNEDNSLSMITVNGTNKYINLTESNIVEFTNKATDYAINGGDGSVEKTVTGNGESIDVAVDELGYYLMIPDGASIQNENSSGSIASISSTTPNATIKIKAVKPTIEKTDDAEDAEVGQVVNYTITGVVPNTTGYEEYKYLITDTMTSGLTFSNDVEVKVGDTVITDKTAIVYTESTNSFTVDIPVVDLQENIGQTITITYTAVVNEQAVEKDQEINSVKLTYGHTPTDTEEFKEEVYSSKIVINKTDNADKKLSGAKFALVNSEGKFYAYDDTNKKVSWVEVEDVVVSDEKTSITSDMISKLLVSDAITTKTTDANGAAEFIGLKNGAYYLVEIEAPTGYNLLANPQKVTINGTNVDNNTELENVAQAGQTEFDSNDNETANVINNSGSLLPSTGGIGTTIFYIIGAVLIIAAIAYFIVRRKGSVE